MFHALLFKDNGELTRIQGGWVTNQEIADVVAACSSQMGQSFDASLELALATGDMAVEFRVMETDLCRYKIGAVVSITPVANQTQHYAATVNEINPVVDEQGAITIRALLDEASDLFDGMNVEVVLSVEN